MNSLYQTPNPIFFDPKGYRWRWFVSLVLLIVVCFSVIGYFFYKTQVTLFSIDQKLNDLNYEAFAYERKLPKKSLLTFLDNEYESYYSIKENITSTAGVVVPWMLINENGKPQPLESELKSLQRDFLQKFKPSVNTFLQITDYNYNLQTPTENNFITFLNTFTPEDVKLMGNYVLDNNFRGVVFSVDSSNWLAESFPKYESFRSQLDVYLKSKNLVIFDSLFLNTNDNYLNSIKGRQTYTILNYWNNEFNIDSPIYRSDQDRGSLNSLISKINSSKFYINFPTFSKDIHYTNEGVVNYEQKISYSKIFDIIKSKNLPIKTDQASKTPYVDYTDEDGNFRKVWIGDSSLTFNQMYDISTILPDSGFEGYSFSNTGLEDQTIWNMIKADTFKDKLDVITNKFIPDTFVENEGKGVVAELKSETQFGIRSFDVIGGTVVNQKWEKIPQRSKVTRKGFQDKTISLTFDDGPDPKYTPAILDVLKKYNIKATFFVIGKQVIEYPDIAKRIVDEGHIIANHTYSHPKLNNLQSVTIDNEITSTDEIVSELLNVKSNYFRTPYNDIFGFNSESDLVVLREVNKYSKFVVEDDVDSKDWLLKDKNAIISKVFGTIDTQGGSVMLFHDGGGNRESTVEALPSIIEGLNTRGYSIKSLNDLAGITVNSNISAQNPEYIQQQVSVTIWEFLLRGLGSFIVFSIVIGLFRYALICFLLLKRVLFKSKFDTSGFSPGVSIIVPCFNEELVIVKSIKSLLNSTYKNIEVVVVDDGSTDNSYAKLVLAFGNNPQVRLFRVANGGKSKAINFGVEKASNEFIISVDADTLFTTKTVGSLMRHFKDPNVGAVAGNIHIGNSKNNLTRSQQLEYCIMQNVDKDGFASVNSVIVVPGAIGAWRKPVILGAGGLHHDNLAEDTDLTLRVLQQGWKVNFEPEAICITECPENYSSLIKQRSRWQLGMLQVIFKNNSLIFNPSFGFTGLFSLPSMVAHYIFSIMYPFMIFSALFYTGYYVAEVYNGGLTLGLTLFFENKIFLFFTILYFVLDLIKIAIALFREKTIPNKYSLITIIPYYLFIYQNILSILTFWSVIRAIKGKRAGWGHLKRSGNVSFKDVYQGS